MKQINRRQFIATTIISALAVACTPSPQKSASFTNTPSRVVALEWVYVEDLLALGIQPVGVADIKGYQEFVNIEPKLAETVVDVGTRQEPSLEAIAKLEPDLILGVQLRHDYIYDTLSSIAPTLLFNPYPAADGLTQLEEMKQTFLTIADAIKRREQGEAVIQQIQETFKRAANQLQDSNLTKNKFILGQFTPSAPQLRLFTDNAMAVQLLTQIGLENAWNGDFDRFGFNTVWVEALPKVQQANFLYIGEHQNAYFQQLKNNPVWKNLAFVQENRLYPIGADTWVFGGPLSARVLVENVVAAFQETGD
ncbi:MULTISPECIES: ABC transporter substrate-binding protein [unclassified Coleofasciculus]|uniref:ABC transporter substrate-binding protein n=1 Tax=unclassified Coleofasciculus TaxID=2692782 RepID=UPI00188076A4|nr:MULTISPECIES: iron-siderophore ABC transporter substrate-binding protein [unclassified Coleofasciculus]MBE9125218.1 iron-siderophore ABC transporter substrate-binding protein [Coleofasciculus sp. LEGE 07081]MBE9148429.1 iron-siderophore ABC transporter substrate-binding protein [Coleofasciculus sp. LEGE 07092]